MRLEDILRRVQELIKMGESVLTTKHLEQYADRSQVEDRPFQAFRSASLSFVLNFFGREHPYYSEFDKRARDAYPEDVTDGLGILEGARGEIEGGWLITTRGLVSAELFSDFLDMASHLLAEGFKDAAAVMIGSVLEEHLRQLCRKHAIDTMVHSPDRVFPKKADVLNADLAKAGAYSKLDHKAVTAWLDLRNKAAHGHYNEYTREQVTLMLQSISDFLTRVGS